MSARPEPFTSDADLTYRAPTWATGVGLVLCLRSDALHAFYICDRDRALWSAAADEIERLTDALAEEQAANSIADMAIEHLTAELQHARNLLGNASGAIADYTNLPTDTKPANAIRILADQHAQDERVICALGDMCREARQLAEWVRANPTQTELVTFPWELDLPEEQP